MLAKKLACSLVALSLAGSGVATAQAAAPARAAAVTDDTNQLTGTTLYIVGAIALALIIWGIIELVDDDEEDFPVSP